SETTDTEEVIGLEQACATFLSRLFSRSVFLRSENAGFPKSRRVIAITMLHTPCWTKPLTQQKKPLPLKL
ncbi:MAG TPA: hypothetical protein VIJ25_05860, partial [Methylococcales bacterium]